MSLKAFHILFIAISSMLCFAIAVGQWAAYAETGATADLFKGGAIAAAGVGLIVYGVGFLKKTKSISLV